MPKKYSLLKKILLNLGLTLPIILFCIPMFVTGNLFPGGDFDMQLQMTEAAKITILKFHQFPFWNPWVAGGVPLFGDPQFGLLTPQTLLSLFIESVMAWKITVFLYLVIGYFSFLKLINYFSNKKYLFNILISYIWIFGSFFTLRVFGGHFTFLVLSLLPLVIYLGLNINKSKNIIWLTILLSYILNASLHYSSIMIVTVGLGIVFITFAVEYLYKLIILKKQKFKQYLVLNLRLVIAFVIATIVNLPRIYISLIYIKDGGVNRTIGGYEKFIGLENGLNSIIVPYQKLNIPPSESSYGIFEASNYIGLATILIFISAFATVLILLIKNRSKFSIKKINIQKISFLISVSVFAILSFIFGLGGYGYAALRLMPVFSSTRVSTRWFFITTFCVLLITSLLLSRIYRAKSSYKHLFTIYLFIAVLEVFYYNFSVNLTLWPNNNSLHSINTNYQKGIIYQEILWNTDTKNDYYALTEATRINKGQIIADIALFDTRTINTQLCDHDDSNCSYIITGNASVVSWSPNKILIKRTAPGKIIINSNSGKFWRVDSENINTSKKILDSSGSFIFGYDNKELYNISYYPY